MNTVTQEVTVHHSGRMLIELDVPADFPVGKAILTLVPENRDPAHVNRAAELRGMGKGKVWMSDDFDEPLELVESRKIAKCRKNCNACDF